MHGPVVAHHGPGEGHDVVHDSARGAQTASDRSAEEVVVVTIDRITTCQSKILCMYVYIYSCMCMISVYMKVALSFRKSS